MKSNRQHLVASALGSEAERNAWQSFWLAHIRMGFGIFLAETSVVAGYLALTPQGPQRSILWVVTGLWFLLALVGMSVTPIVASKPWCAAFSMTWTAISSFGVAILASLDTGIDSPLLLLLFLPLIFGTLMFTPRAASACSLATLASVAFVALTDSHVTSSSGQLLLLFAAIAGACALTVIAAINRTHIEQHNFRLCWQIWRPLMNSQDVLSGGYWSKG
jgi:hypothetical protein